MGLPDSPELPFVLTPRTSPPRVHLTACLSALLIAAAVLALDLVSAQRRVTRFVHALSSDFSDAKLHGAAIQKQAFRENDLLILYGSSELVQEVPNTASEFFEDYPTGFRVFPVGKPGTTSLAVLQKIAAVGTAASGRKLAISLSPSSYFAEEVDAGYYAGNFSQMQAQELVFCSPLSGPLKRDIARRMLEYPKTIEDDWLLSTALRRLAGDSLMDRILFRALVPLGMVQVGIGRVQDYLEAASRIEEMSVPTEHRRPRVLNWADAMKKAESLAVAIRARSSKPKAPAITKRPKGTGDKAFLQTLARADEWDDFELLLRVLRELKAQPLILSMPVHGQDLENLGVSKTARGDYEERLTKLTSRYSAPLVYFRQNEEDPNFFYDNLDHLGPRGWVFYNKMLDDFFHGRLTKR